MAVNKTDSELSNAISELKESNKRLKKANEQFAGMTLGEDVSKSIKSTLGIDKLTSTLEQIPFAGVFKAIGGSMLAKRNQMKEDQLLSKQLGLTVDQIKERRKAFELQQAQKESLEKLKEAANKLGLAGDQIDGITESGMALFDKRSKETGRFQSEDASKRLGASGAKETEDKREQLRVQEETNELLGEIAGNTKDGKKMEIKGDGDGGFLSGLLGFFGLGGLMKGGAIAKLVAAGGAFKVFMTATFVPGMIGMFTSLKTSAGVVTGKAVTKVKDAGKAFKLFMTATFVPGMIGMFTSLTTNMKVVGSNAVKKLLATAKAFKLFMLGTFIPGMIAMLTSVATTLAPILVAAAPFILAAAAIGAALYALYEMFNAFSAKFEETGSVGEALYESILTLMSAPVRWIKSIVSQVAEWLGFEEFSAYLDSVDIIQGIKDLINKVVEFFSFDWEMPSFSDYIPKWLGGGGKPISELFGGAPEQVSSGGKAFKDMSKEEQDAYKKRAEDTKAYIEQRNFDAYENQADVLFGTKGTGDAFEKAMEKQRKLDEGSKQYVNDKGQPIVNVIQNNVAGGGGAQTTGGPPNKNKVIPIPTKNKSYIGDAIQSDF